MAELEDECHALKQRAISAESAADALQVCGKNNYNYSAETSLRVCLCVCVCVSYFTTALILMTSTLLLSSALSISAESAGDA